VETNPALNIADARDKDLSHMSVDSLLAARSKHHGRADGRLHVWAAFGTPRGAPLSSFKTVADACHENSIGLTMHCAEAPADLGIYRDIYEGMSPMEFCTAAGIIGENRRTVLAHMCHLDLPKDAELAAKAEGTTVAHNPSSNLKLASGVAAVPDLRSAGVNVALGTDGAPCNNTYDMLREMHLAAMLHKGVRHDASVLGAHEALEMATIYGAKALGLQEVGSLEAGKKADLVVLDVRQCWAAPWDPARVREGAMDPVSLVVGSCTGRDVELVMVDGETLVEGGRLVGVDETALFEAARKAVKGIQERSGVKATPKQGWLIE
jgi:cytosine/adenosine deaminase-related metal-dependent hydrolase